MKIRSSFTYLLLIVVVLSICSSLVNAQVFDSLRELSCSVPIIVTDRAYGTEYDHEYDRKDTVPKTISLGTPFYRSKLVEHSQVGNTFKFRYRDSAGYSSQGEPLDEADRNVTFTVDPHTKKILDLIIGYYRNIGAGNVSGHDSYTIYIPTCEYSLIDDSLFQVDIRGIDLLNAIGSVQYHYGFFTITIPKYQQGQGVSKDFLSLSQDTVNYSLKMTFEPPDALSVSKNISKHLNDLLITTELSTGNIICSYVAAPMKRSLDVYDIFGKKIEEFPINAGITSMTLPTVNLATGCYLLKLGNASQTIQIVK